MYPTKNVRICYVTWGSFIYFVWYWLQLWFSCALSHSVHFSLACILPIIPLKTMVSGLGSLSSCHDNTDVLCFFFSPTWSSVVRFFYSLNIRLILCRYWLGFFTYVGSLPISLALSLMDFLSEFIDFYISNHCSLPLLSGVWVLVYIPLSVLY